LFDGIAYGKTAAVLHMLESYLSPETFRAGVNLYLQEHAYGNATAADFWSAMARASREPVDQMMPTFVMQAGEPYVGVEAKCDGGNTNLALSQKRYFNTSELFEAPNDQLWQIPVCVKSGSQSQCFLLTQRRQQFSLKGCSNFVFPDAGALGYYRFDYDTDALHRLGADAEKTLTPEERIALVGNEWALMRAGQHKAGDYLALGAQFKNTPGYVLLDNFAMHLEFINDNLVGDSDRSQFQVWLRQTFSPMLQQLGYAAHPDDTPTVRQKRAILFEMLGNVAEDPQVIAQAGTLIQQYMNDPQSVDGTLARAVVQVAARHGNAELYAQFKAKMKDAKTPEQYYRYFYALGQFRQPDLIKQTLEATLTPEVRSQDLYVLPRMMENQAAQDQTWDFMRQNFNELEKKTGGGLGGFGIFLYATEGFCNQQKAQQVEQFFQQHPFPGTERNQKAALETINSCVSLRGQQQTKLAAWLKQNAPLNATVSSSTTTGSNPR
jgi:aminopeptidase N